MRPKSRETTDSLGKILDVFAAGRPEELGQIRNGIFAGILAELIAYRKAEDAELEIARTYAGLKFGHITEIQGVPRIVLAGARFKSALAELDEACKEVLGDTLKDPGGLDSIVETTRGMIDKLVDLIMQNATELGDVPDRPDRPDGAITLPGKMPD